MSRHDELEKLATVMRTYRKAAGFSQEKFADHHLVDDAGCLLARHHASCLEVKCFVGSALLRFRAAMNASYESV